MLNFYILIKEKNYFLNSFFQKGKFFFQFNNFSYDKFFKKRCNTIFLDILKKIFFNLNFLKNFNFSKLKFLFSFLIKNTKFKFNKIVSIFRFIITKKFTGPDLFKFMEFLGKKEVLFRMKKIFY